MVDILKKEHGRIDILVNNVGWNRLQAFMKDTPEFWEKIISLNLKANVFCSHAVLKVMIEQKSGKIVNIGSDSGRLGNPRDSVYSACKSGLIGLTKSLAREMGRYGININCVSPGPTETQLLHSAFSDASQEEAFVKGMEKVIPLKRIGRPEDIAHAVLFFVSDEAEYVTGQVVSVSGGLTMV
jgi:2-hydroxycyclohexanecarboxyl-CoA dehydrogenase